MITTGTESAPARSVTARSAASWLEKRPVTLAGPIVGGLIFGILPEVLREVASPEMQWVIYGLFMIAIVFFLPDGIVPALASWWRDRFGAGGGGAEPEPDTLEERA